MDLNELLLLHIGFYVFTIEYIFMNLTTTKKTEKLQPS